MDADADADGAVDADVVADAGLFNTLGSVDAEVVADAGLFNTLFARGTSSKRLGTSVAMTSSSRPACLNLAMAKPERPGSRMPSST